MFCLKITSVLTYFIFFFLLLFFIILFYLFFDVGSVALSRMFHPCQVDR